MVASRIRWRRSRWAADPSSSVVSELPLVTIPPAVLVWTVPTWSDRLPAGPGT